MLPTHGLSRIHPLSCLSVSQREAVPSPRQVRKLLGKSYGNGNLSILHPARLVSLIRRAFPLLCSTASLRFQTPFTAPESAPWCVPSLRSSLYFDQKRPSRISTSERNPAISSLSLGFENSLLLGCGIAVGREGGRHRSGVKRHAGPPNNPQIVG